MRFPTPVLGTVVLVALAATAPKAQQNHASAGGEGARELSVRSSILAPTAHPPFSRELSQLWLAPARADATSRTSHDALARASAFSRTGEHSKSLAVVPSPSSQQGSLTQYAAYYAALAQLNLGRAEEARRAFKALREQDPVGFLSEAAAYGEADAAIAMKDADAAISIYEKALKGTPSSVDATLLRLGRAYEAAGERTKAAETFARLYYEFALSELAWEAGGALAPFANVQPIAPGSQRYQLELGRAERLFGARQYAVARGAFEELRPVATSEDRELIQLRIAESDYFLKRFQKARDGVRPFITRASRQAEALYFFAVASRELGDTATFLDTSRTVVTQFPQDSWAEESLNALGTHYLKTSDDERAAEVFRELYERFPRGGTAERAAWKAGWYAYRQRRYADTARFFDRAAADFPRSDYRPSWLYWAGRAHEALGAQADADERYSVAIADYLNTYYGRLTMKHLGDRGEVLRAQVMAARQSQPQASAAPLPPNAPIVRALLGAEMFDDALNELRYARRVWGNSPAVEATTAWINLQQSRRESGMTRLLMARSAINGMRRAYPQYMTAGGDDLPRDVQAVIFPIAYWESIQKHAATNQLDPYLVAALVAQESTFVADVRSHANAYGLMQLIPSTARMVARKVKVPYSSRVLTDPEANLRLGTAYLAEKIREFGDTHLALASYNAGERPVYRWKAEKPGLPRDEFIDDIPYPETQQYVRKILSTAEDYRRLYGSGVPAPDVVDRAPARAPAKVSPPKKVRPVPRTTPAPRKKTPPRKR